jgi:cation diffusion facilitator CzcD-associated flavoprotein CzcO
MGSIESPEPHFDVIVVGGGFCGVYQLQNLRKLGFRTRLYEAGSELGGIWYWNAYPGARVDTAVPTYQLTDPESWKTFDWKQRFPDRDELQDYFKHLDKTWNLSQDINFNSRVTAMTWDKTGLRWNCEINHGERTCTAWSVILCTGFASKRFVPDFKNLTTFQRVVHHTAVWPQSGVALDGKRVAVIGTGASGVQVIQEVAKIASHMTVYQRTPNTALPMENPDVTSDHNNSMRLGFPEVKKAIETTFAGFDYEFAVGHPAEIPYEERMKLYEKLYHTGGLHFWLGTYMDILFQPDPNEEAYQFWRNKTLPRIKDPKVAEILAPKKKAHPFGTKRISLEQRYFEIFNQDNVDIVNLRENPIEEFVETGIKTADGTIQEFDVVILATGFDSITGGITQMNIRGTDGQTVEDKWKDGTYTHLGMATSGFPNMFFTYGPQAPTAFATGPSSAETQGAWIIDCLKYMRERKIASIDATHEAEGEWRKHVNEVAEKSLFPLADSWYFGAVSSHIPHVPFPTKSTSRTRC